MGIKKIRQIKDFKEICNVYNAAVSKSFTWKERSNLSVIAFIERTKEETFFLASTKGQIVAFLSYYEPDHFIHLLFVLPEFQGKGFGQKLLEACIAAYKTEKIYLKCTVKNKTALLFYRKNGFKILNASFDEQGEKYYTLQLIKKQKEWSEQMKTLGKHLQSLKKEGKGIVVPYIMAGDHEKGVDGLAETIDFLSQNGASAIELGIPFSDPVADGPVIEEAGLRALAKNVSLTEILQKLKTIKTEVPLVLMTYFNPIFVYGVEKFIQDIEKTSVKGIIIPDLPYEHNELVETFLKNSDVALVPLVSLTTTDERKKTLVKEAQGFVYAVAVNGVTGIGRDYSEGLDKHLQKLTEISKAPVLAGFGVSNIKHVQRFAKVCDGVIVGSFVVKHLHEGKKKELADFLQRSVSF